MNEHNPSDQPLPSLPNTLAVVTYLRERGWEVAKSKCYADKARGLLLVQPDGSVYKSDADIYAAHHLEKVDAEEEFLKREILRLEREIKAKELERLTIHVEIARLRLWREKATAFVRNIAHGAEETIREIA